MTDKEVYYGVHPAALHFYVYKFKVVDGKPVYLYECTTGTEQSAKNRVEDFRSMGIKAVYLVGHTINGAFM